MLDLATLLTLAGACAPGVAPQTLAAIAKVESGFDPLVIGVNRPRRSVIHARTAAEASTTARRLLASGADVDLGLGQINGRNLAWLGLSVEAAFDPCRNLAAAAAVLRDGFRRAGSGPRQFALRTALSYYNTGHPERGLRNGYVVKVIRAAAALADRSARPQPEGPPPAATQAPPAWDVFGRGATVRAAFVLTPTAGDLP